MQRRRFITASSAVLVAGTLALGDETRGQVAVGKSATLRRSRPGNLTSLDPHRPISATDMEIAADLFVGLTAVDARGAVVPGCAREWRIAADGRRYEFLLRSGLQWSDGRALVAEDFVASFRRLLDPATAALLGYRYDAIRGAEALRTGRGKASELGVRAAGDRVIFELEHADTDLLKLLAVAYVVPMHAVREFGRDWAKPPQMVVNGAYRPVSWAQNGSLVLERNARWHEMRSSRAATRLEWIMGLDDATRLRLFRSGELDVAQLAETASLALARRELATSLRSTPFYGGGWVGLNLRRPALQDRRLRRALALAVDRATLCEKVRGLGERPSESVVPEAVADYPTRARPDYADWPMSRRLQEARSLCASLGLQASSPRRLVGIFSSNPLTQRTFLALDAMWGPLGVRIDARGMESRAYNQALNAGDFDLMDYGPFSAVQSATSFIGRFQSGSFLNYSGFVDTEVDRLIALAERQTSAAERARLYLAAERILLRELPVIPLYSAMAHRLVANRVRGWVDNPGLSLPSQFLSVS